MEKPEPILPILAVLALFFILIMLMAMSVMIQNLKEYLYERYT
jgi:hypothetical protein